LARIDAAAANKPFAFIDDIVAQARPNTHRTNQAMAALSPYGIVAPAVVHEQADYRSSMIDGRTVIETNPKGRSASEIRELWQFV
jgi:chromosome partitioning protein